MTNQTVTTQIKNIKYACQQDAVKHMVRNAFPEYRGRKIKLVFCTEMTFFDTNWSGGTKNEYVAFNIHGEVARLTAPAPWVNPVEGMTIPMPRDAAIICHSFFCGHDGGIKIYLHSEYAPAWQLTAGN